MKIEPIILSVEQLVARLRARRKAAPRRARADKAAFGNKRASFRRAQRQAPPAPSVAIAPARRAPWTPKRECFALTADAVLAKGKQRRAATAARRVEKTVQPRLSPSRRLH